MSTKYLTAHALAKALQAEGLIPPNTRSVTLALPADGAVALHYEVLMEADDLLKFSRALAAFAEAKRAFDVG